MKQLLPALLLSLLSQYSFGQQTASNAASTDYATTIRQRAGKIVDKTGITDAAKAARVTDLVAAQYIALNSIQEARDGQLKMAEASPDAIKAIRDSAAAQTARLHTTYIQSLQRELSQAQVDQVKDGMTFGVLPLTYKAYHDMIPTLTAAQSAQIMTWLVEARELAMDAESADKKHATFGKYKGRINNYLSAAGYDLKKEGEAWEKRRKSAELTTK